MGELLLLIGSVIAVIAGIIAFLLFKKNINNSKGSRKESTASIKIGYPKKSK